MKPKLLTIATLSYFLSIIFFSCGPVKRGCPSDGANVGAERVLSGEKKLKKSKFKIKNME